MRTVLQESKHNYIKTDYLDKSVWLPQLIPGTSVSWGIVLAVLVAIFVWFILYKTSLGYRIRVTGLNKEAAGMAGINPQKQYMLAFAISGAIAGFAGFIEVNGMQHMMLPDFNVDIASFGVGIAILANSHPLGIIFAALLFGLLKEGQSCTVNGADTTSHGVRKHARAAVKKQAGSSCAAIKHGFLS